MKLISGLVFVSIIVLAFQNCGEIPLTEAGNFSSSSTFNALTDSPTISMAKTSNSLSNSASLFSAVNLTSSDNLNRVNKERGFDLIIENGAEWIKCGFDPGGATANGRVGATVNSFDCYLSDAEFTSSDDESSVSYNLYQSLEKLHQDQSVLPAYLQTVTLSGSSYSISDIDGQFTCELNNGFYSCGYASN